MEFRVYRGSHDVFGNVNNVSESTNNANLERRRVECRAIPPERIGITGEYDHDGLASRVRLLLSEHLTDSVTTTLRISQRGRVVVVIGPWLTEEIAQKIVTLSLQVEGAGSVEVNGIHLSFRSRPISHIESNQYFLNVS
jgi:hypothetical protein